MSRTWLGPRHEAVVARASVASPAHGLRNLAHRIGNRNMAVLARNGIKWPRVRRNGTDHLQGGPMALVNPDPLGDQGVTQQMVPSAKDLEEVKKAIANRPGWSELSPVQAWSLIASEKKGALHRAGGAADQAGASRIAALNEAIGGAGPAYDAARDLPAIHQYMHYSMRLATNFKLTTPITKAGSESTSTLIELMLEDAEGRIRNMWETGASQASADPNPRGDVERQMGYAPALGPEYATYGYDPADPKWSQQAKYKLVPGKAPAPGPGGLKPRELPKYAGLVTPFQPAGVGPRYGKTVIYWKPNVRTRATMTAGDSWGFSALEATRSFVSTYDVDWIFAKTSERMARVIAAAATKGAYDRATWQQLQGGQDRTNEYIECQIHGDLSWADADEVVVNWGAPAPGERGTPEGYDSRQADKLIEQLKALRRKGGYTFKIRKGIETVALHPKV